MKIFSQRQFLAVTTIGLCLRSYLVYHFTLFCISHFADILMKHLKMFSWMQFKKETRMMNASWASNFPSEDGSEKICWFNFIAECQIFIVLQLSIRCFVASLPNKLQTRWEIKVLWTQKTNPLRPSETQSKIFAFPSDADQIENFRSRINLFLFFSKCTEFLLLYFISAVQS